MTRDLFSSVVLPVADEQDGVTTARGVLPYVEKAGGEVLVVNVVEKAGGAIDKASVEQREMRAEEIFEAVLAVFEEAGIEAESKIAYGTDVPETIFEVAAEADASAIVFTPRGGSRWVRLLTGDTALDLVTNSDRPVVALPDTDRTEEASTGDRDADGESATKSRDDEEGAGTDDGDPTTDGVSEDDEH